MMMNFSKQDPIPQAKPLITDLNLDLQDLTEVESTSVRGGVSSAGIYAATLYLKHCVPGSHNARLYPHSSCPNS